MGRHGLCCWAAADMLALSRLYCDGGDGCVCLPITAELKRLTASKPVSGPEYPLTDNDTDAMVYQVEI
jgi:hypothetical protein